MSDNFKVENYLFGVWKTKARNGNHCIYFDTEREAWEYLASRARSQRGSAQKDLNKANRDHAKALWALQRIEASASGTPAQKEPR